MKVGDNSQFHVETVHHDIFLEDHVTVQLSSKIERKSSINACIGVMKLENFLDNVNGKFQGEKGKKKKKLEG